MIKRLLLVLALLCVSASVAEAQWRRGYPTGRVYSGSGAPPASACASLSDVGHLYARNDGEGVGTTLYVCANAAASTYAWELAAGAAGSGCIVSGSNNQVITDDGAGGCVSETNLTFDGTTLTASNIGTTNLTGAMTVPTGGSIAASGTGTISATDSAALNGTTAVLTSPAQDEVLAINASSQIVNKVVGLVSRADNDGTVSFGAGDRNKVVNVGHATANAVSIAEAGALAGNGFVAGFQTFLCTTGAGTTTLTPTTSTINIGDQALTTLVLGPGDCARIYVPTEDDTDYRAIVFRSFYTLTVHQWGTGASNVIQDTDDWADAWIAKYPIVITQICGRTDTGTSTFNLQRDDGTAVSIAASNIVADTTEACTSTFTAGENTISTGHAIDLLQVTGATSGAPTHITITVSYVRK